MYNVEGSKFTFTYGFLGLTMGVSILVQSITIPYDGFSYFFNPFTKSMSFSSLVGGNFIFSGFTIPFRHQSSGGSMFQETTSFKWSVQGEGNFFLSQRV